MALNITLPHIAITPEAEEDDDNHLLSLTEALTDVEDLLEENNAENNKVKKYKTKLKIKIKSTEDDGLTDLEDVEASDKEEDIILVKHKKPILLDDLDLEGGVFEETYKTQTKNSRGKKKMRTQVSTVKKEKPEKLGLTEYTEGTVTDVEDFETDEDIPQYIPDMEIDLDRYKPENIDISDSLTRDEDSPLATPKNVPETKNLGVLYRNSQFLSTLSLSPNLSDFTDVEVVESDSDDDKAQKKTKHRKRRNRYQRLKEIVTDVEELDVSGNEKDAAPKKSRGNKNRNRLIVQRPSLPCDSDNDSNSVLPFPVCKKIAEKRNAGLHVPEFDIRAQTDTEDFEAENQFDDEEKEVDESALNEKMNDLAECYSQIKERIDVSKGNQKCRSASLQFDSDDQHDTDFDDYQTDSEADEISRRMSSDMNFDIKFINDEKISKAVKARHQLNLPLSELGAITDTENIDSSPEMESKKIPLALVRSALSSTDDEVIESDEYDLDNIPEISLPPPQRTLVIVEDNDTILPTIRILPLDDDEPVMSQMIHECDTLTDEEEYVDYEEDFLNIEEIDRAPTPDLHYPDGGSTNVVEHIVKPRGGALIVPKDNQEGVTDTEDLEMETNRQTRRPPKLKQMQINYKKDDNKLVAQENVAALTDSEDVYLSDGEKHSIAPTNLLAPNPGVEATTDVEDLDGSDDEAVYNRALSCTPQHMREMSGEVILTKEGSGPFSSNDRLTVNQKIRLDAVVIATPFGTDSEDIAGSGDEDNTYSRTETATPNQIHRNLDCMSSTKIKSEQLRMFDSEAADEVMYLKGGGYRVQDTDIEEIGFEEDVYKDEEELLFENAVSLNIKEGSVSFGMNREWDATRKPTEPLSSPGQAIERDAAQIGEIAEHAASQEGHQSALKAEGDEPQERESSERTQTRQVADQHQLSDEMKELLKELEKESKQ